MVLVIITGAKEEMRSVKSEKSVWGRGRGWVVSLNKHRAFICGTVRPV